MRRIPTTTNFGFLVWLNRVMSDCTAILSVVLGCALLSGCAPRSQSPALSIPEGRPDLQAILVQKPEENPSRFQKAVHTYRAYLAGHPEDAEGHLEFGMLLTDLELPGEAQFHLRLYEAAGASPTKEKILLEYLEKCEKMTSSGASADGELIAELTQRNIQLSKLRKSAEALEKRNQELTEENEKLEKKLADRDRRISMMLSGSDTETVPPHPADAFSQTKSSGSKSSSGANLSGRTRGTYTVQEGDTLRSIAQKVYGDASRSQDIRSINPGKVGPKDSLTVGDVLVCP